MKPETSCCERCKSYWYDKCDVSDCSCHNREKMRQPQKFSPEEEKIRMDMFKNSTPPTSESWSERFDKEILKMPLSESLELYLVPQISNANKIWLIENKTLEIKSFIAEELAKAREEVVGEAIKESKKFYWGHYDVEKFLCSLLTKTN